MENDEFKIGDTVYDAIMGKGEVIGINLSEDYPVLVDFENESLPSGFTLDGKFYTTHPRTLFFSVPQIIGNTKRPFEPKLVGKFVAYQIKDRGIQSNLLWTGTVKEETEHCLTFSSNGLETSYDKDLLEAIYILGENKR